MTDFRYVSWPEYGNLTSALAEKVRSKGRKFDLVIGIARGGMPVAMVVADDIDVRVDFINVKASDGKSKKGTPRILSTLTEGLRGKSLLVVDDVIDKGSTMKMVKRFLKDMRPKLLESAVLFKKPWSEVEPDYFLDVVDKWIVFPYELSDVNRLKRETGPGPDKRSD
jgi:uncharacterized protein